MFGLQGVDNKGHFFCLSRSNIALLWYVETSQKLYVFIWVQRLEAKGLLILFELFDGGKVTLYVNLLLHPFAVSMPDEWGFLVWISTVFKMNAPLWPKSQRDKRERNAFLWCQCLFMHNCTSRFLPFEMGLGSFSRPVSVDTCWLIVFHVLPEAMYRRGTSVYDTQS